MNTQTLLDASEEVGIQINPKVAEYMVMYCHQNEQNHNIRFYNKSFKNGEKLNYFGTSVTNQNCSHNGIQNR
jgi:hypothetical protein